MSLSTASDPRDGVRRGRLRLRQSWVAVMAVVITAAAVAAVVRQLSGAKSGGAPADVEAGAVGLVERPLGLPPVPCPEDNRPTPAKVELGRRLFFDPILSHDRTISCATCHDPQRGFTISQPVATGIGGQKGRRHPPALVNVAYNTLLFWDGRVGNLGQMDSLERQALEPIRDPREMDLDPDAAARRLCESDDYRRRFQEVFGRDPAPDLIAKAIAAFERTLLSGNAPYDRYEAGDPTAMSPAAIRGKELFFWKATCVACHRGPNFTDNALHASIASKSGDEADLGRADVTGKEADRGAFKTPTLRDVGGRAPYMHDGSIATLEEVVERYNRGGFDTHYWTSENRSRIEHLMTSDDEGAVFRKMAAPQLRSGFPLRLTPEEQRDLVTFLREGLSGDCTP